MTHFIIYKSQEIMTHLEIGFPHLMHMLVLDKVCQIIIPMPSTFYCIFLIDPGSLLLLVR